MCCLLTVLLFFGPRLAIIVWWLYDTFGANINYFDRIFPNGFLLPLLGLIFLPWTLLMYMLVAPGGIIWWEWIFIGLAVVIDIGGYTGGYQNRGRAGMST